MRRRIVGMKLRQVFTVLVMCTAMAVAPAGDVNAENIETGSTETEMQEAAEYDLGEGGTQSFEILDENGEETEIVVEEVPGIARVANGTYKITGKYKGHWTAGFYIDISGNRLVKAHDKFYKVTKGSISNMRLSKESDAQATLTLNYKYHDFTKISKVKAKILNKKLIIKTS